MQVTANLCSLVSISHNLMHSTIQPLPTSGNPVTFQRFCSSQFSILLCHFYFLVYCLYWASLFIHSLHMPQPSQLLFPQELFQFLYTNHFMNFLIILFSRLSRHHLQHSHFCSLQFPFIVNFKSPTFSNIC